MIIFLAGELIQRDANTHSLDGEAVHSLRRYTRTHTHIYIPPPPGENVGGENAEELQVSNNPAQPKRACPRPRRSRARGCRPPRGRGAPCPPGRPPPPQQPGGRRQRQVPTEKDGCAGSPPAPAGNRGPQPAQHPGNPGLWCVPVAPLPALTLSPVYILTSLRKPVSNKP